MASVTTDLETDFDDSFLSEMFDFDLTETAKLVGEAVLAEEKCPFDAEVSIYLTGDERIREENAALRGIDAVTDVLSFPAFEYGEPGAFAEAEKDRVSAFDPENGRLILGDIMINANRVVSQAEDYGHSRKREFAFLVAHSILHLTGYDHMTPEEEALMFCLQEKVLEKLGILRD